jgi:regulator of replication initiation timing
LLKSDHAKQVKEMNDFLQAKIEQNMQLEVTNDELKDAYRSLEANLSQEDREFKHRAQQLERNVDQISTLYHVSTL